MQFFHFLIKAFVRPSTVTAIVWLFSYVTTYTKIDGCECDTITTKVLVRFI